MKIILTEKQLELLKLITENEDVINQFKNKINSINNAINKLYTDINFISIAELLNGEINLSNFTGRHDQIENEYYKLSKDMEKYFKSFGDDAYFDKWVSIHDNLDDMNHNNSDKINVIASILMDLESLVSDNENTKELFSDIKSINLS
jgi:hypothetical protein